jgi:NAD(P)-dependent dehydrogenase (short-subunit alcohol dehydrogenase family)
MRTRQLIAGLVGGALAYAAIQRGRQADLRGQVALVTGGTRGLGFLLARELGRAGCRVAICGRDAEQVARAAGVLAQEGGEVKGFPCDVADASQVERMLDELQMQWGQIDILVNNAGIIQVGPVERMTKNDFAAAMDIMFWGVVHPTLALLPQMRERRYGRIVNITSVGGVVSVPHLVSYSAAKWAAVGLSEGLAAELSKDGIQVTTVIPGLMRTGSHLQAQFLEPQDEQFRLFAPLASLPIISIDAERAARRVVAAMRRGERELILSLPANLLARVHGVMPGITTRTLATLNRWLPAEGGDADRVAIGAEIEQRSASPALEALTSFGRDAARRFLQRPPSS